MASEKLIEFDPDQHLCFQKPDVVYTWADLGFHKDEGVSSFCAAEPFPLFSPTAISEMRKEVLQPQVLNNYSYSDNNTAMSVRGYAAAHAPFTSAAWKHPRTLEALSDIAGVDLVVKIELELGHVNFGVRSSQKRTAVQAPDESESRNSDDTGGIIGWHKDSYPFSCTLMLSDSKDMKGGEIVVERADGRLHKIRQCQTGSVVFLQGRHLVHTGLKVDGPNVRMTMVCPLWPASPFLPDDTFLTYTRAISDTSELYGQYADYRFGMLIDRLLSRRQQDLERRRSGAKLDTTGLKRFIQEQSEFLVQMQKEILEEEKTDTWGYKRGNELPQLAPEDLIES